MRKIEVIAECGVNHSGSFNTALAMIKKAKEVGADTVKFQLVDPDFYEKGSELYEIFKKTFLPPSDHFKLKTYAEKIGIDYLCTPSDLHMCKVLVEIVGVKRIKIASDSAKNIKLLQYLEQNSIPHLISTGYMESAKEVVDWSKDLDPSLATILHCVSKYPCPINEARLSMIQEIKNKTPFRVGYSDHTNDIKTPAIAVGAGAIIIEKHFMIDKNCVDAPVSLLPDDFERMINLVREAEKML